MRRHACVLVAVLLEMRGDVLVMAALDVVWAHRLAAARALPSSSGLAVEFVARAVGKAGVVLMIVNATEQRIAMVRVI